MDIVNKPSLTIVVATDRQGGIGINNRLPWHLPEDLAHFKRLTTGHAIIMGRKTFDSIGRALPNRRNIVVTRDAAWHHDGVEAVNSLETACRLEGLNDVFIIGGAQIYAQALPLADRLVVTEIQASYACDAFFPTIDPAQWTEVSRHADKSAAGDLAFDIVIYRKNHSFKS